MGLHLETDRTTTDDIDTLEFHRKAYQRRLHKLALRNACRSNEEYHEGQDEGKPLSRSDGTEEPAA